MAALRVVTDLSARVGQVVGRMHDLQWDLPTDEAVDQLRDPHRLLRPRHRLAHRRRTRRGGGGAPQRPSGAGVVTASSSSAPTSAIAGALRPWPLDQA